MATQSKTPNVSPEPEVKTDSRRDATRKKMQFSDEPATPTLVIDSSGPPPTGGGSGGPPPPPKPPG
jgi:hypothetical protein